MVWATYSEEEYYVMIHELLLASTNYLRQVFRRVWKVEKGSEWLETESSEILPVSLTEYKDKSWQEKVEPFSNLKKLEEWDISLLSVELKKLVQKSNYGKETSAINKLVDVRNTFTHQSFGRVSGDLYTKWAKTISTSLKSLGMEVKDIDKMRKDIEGAADKEAWKIVKMLLDRAKKSLKQGKLDKALRKYSEAIEMPRLSPEHLGKAYEKRAECYQKRVKDLIVDKLYIDEALRDAKTALGLNENSWNAYSLVGKCYKMKNNLHEAIRHFEKVLAISPSQDEVKNDLYSCKRAAILNKMEDHLNPQQMPTTIRDAVMDLKKMWGLVVGEEDYIKIVTIAHEEKNRNVPGASDFLQGSRHFNGIGIPISFHKAFELFQKSAGQNNFSAMHAVAVCYINGHGVRQNFKEGLRQLKELAKMEMMWPGLSTATPFRAYKSMGNALHGIGCMYADGTGVNVDHFMAASYFEQAMEHGIGFAACNLGYMYNAGKGVDLDRKMAELCWREAVCLKTVPMFPCLVHYYVNELEPEMALHFFNFGKAMMNHQFLGTSEEEFDGILGICKETRDDLKEDLEIFEKANLLDKKGMTFSERMIRQFRALSPEDKTEKTYLVGEHKRHSAGRARPLTVDMRQEIRERAVMGSKTAQQFVKALDCSTLIEKKFEGKLEFTAMEKLEILDLVYRCLKIGYHLVPVSRGQGQKVKSILESMIQEEKYGRVGPVDMKLRLCYVAFNLADSLRSHNPFLSVEMLKVGIKRYPENIHYYIALSIILLQLDNCAEGKLVAKEGLKRNRNNVELLFADAAFFAATATRDILVEGVDKFRKFLEVAPPDHRMVPDAYYNISLIRMFTATEATVAVPGRGTRSRTKRFGHARKVEEDQLPCYLPYDRCSVVKAYDMLVGYDADNWNEEIDIRIMNVAFCDQEQKKSVLERKSYLKSPTRKTLIRLHRRDMRITKQGGFQSFMPDQLLEPMNFPNFRQKRAKALTKLRAISLYELNTVADRIFEHKLIELTILVEPHVYDGALLSVAEDDNGDVARLQIHNFWNVKNIYERFAVGSRIAVVNPCMQVEGENKHNWLRVDDVRCIIFMKSLKKMCGFCGEANASHECSKCKRVYCSGECLDLDWKMNDHELVCPINLAVQSHAICCSCTHKTP